MADALLRNVSNIIEANAADLARGSEKLSASLLDRLMLNEKRIGAIAEGLRLIAGLPRSARRDAAGIFAPKRAAHREGASAARCHRHYL